MKFRRLLVPLKTLKDYYTSAIDSATDGRPHAHETLTRLRKEVARVVIGQDAIVNRLLIALLVRGHVLVEGLPGLAKTLLVKTLAQAIDGTFKRIQFTPDLLPADITGTQIFDPAGRTFNARLGPIFANFILADEINRAPAKVQSALLEAMQERQRSRRSLRGSSPRAPVRASAPANRSSC